MQGNLLKILLALIGGVIVYLSAFVLLTSIFQQSQQPVSMMQSMYQSTSMNQSNFLYNAVSILIAFVAVFAIVWALKIDVGFKTGNSTNSMQQIPQISREQELEILKKALNEDGKKVLDEVGKAGEITQDSLRFRLDWSKAKISTILTNLDKQGLIQRERTGKTYKVFLQKFK